MPGVKIAGCDCIVWPGVSCFLADGDGGTVGGGGRVVPRIDWRQRSPELLRWLAAHSGASPLYASTGREAEIWHLGDAERPAFTVKRWTRWRHVDAGAAHDVLLALAASGLAVSGAAGWGIDQEGNGILAMRHAGRPLTPGEANDCIEQFGRELAAIHRTPLEAIEHVARRDDTTTIDHLLHRYLFNLDAHPDIAAILATLQDTIPPSEARLIHGDFHLGNALTRNGRLIICDWTEARIGDMRWDLALANILLLIYTGEEAYERFLAAYRLAAEAPPNQEELRQFEVIAGLYWLFLARTATVPIEQEKIDAALAFVRARLPASLGGVLAD